MTQKARSCISRLGYAIIFLICLFDVEAAIKRTFVEDVCRYHNMHMVDFRFENTGILMASPFHAPIDCMIILQPRPRYSTVLSIYKYELDQQQDTLTIKDFDGFKIAINGVREFPNEKKSIISEGKMTIHYLRNETSLLVQNQGFQFTFTQVKSSPCSPMEFRCANDRCVPRELVCDGHNHCGDNSDQKECVPIEDTYSTTPYIYPRRQTYHVPSIIYIACGSIIILSIIITIIVLVVRRVKAKKANKTKPSSTGNEELSSSAATASVSQNALQRPTVLNQIRRSLHLQRPPQTEELPRQQTSPEAYEVPALYPNLNQLPLAPDYNGVDNPSFRTGQ